MLDGNIYSKGEPLYLNPNYKGYFLNKLNGLIEIGILSHRRKYKTTYIAVGEINVYNNINEHKAYPMQWFIRETDYRELKLKTILNG